MGVGCAGRVVGTKSGAMPDITPLKNNAQSLKILHVIPSIAARYGGPSQAVYSTCRSLLAEGAEILIATTNADGESALPVVLEQKITYQGVTTIFFDRQFSEALKYSRPLAGWLGRHVRDFGLVHIHAVFSHACIAAANACRKNNIPYIVRPLGTLDPWSLKQKQLRKRLLWHFGVKQMLRCAAAIHYTTAEEKRLVESELGLMNGVVIPNGIDLDQAAQQEAASSPGLQLLPVGAPYILALSRIHPKKGYELLIESFGALKRQGTFSDWHLIFAGDGDAVYVDQLKKLAESNGLNGDVRFVGWLEGERKFQALKASALLALPSYQENFGISLVEAMACGVPVLVSPQVNLAPEIATAGAGWVTPSNPQTLTETLKEALGNEQERHRRGHNGRKLANRFSDKTVAAELIRLYQSLLNRADQN